VAVIVHAGKWHKNNDTGNNNSAEGLQKHLKWKFRSHEAELCAPSEPSFTKSYCGQRR